MNPVLSVKVVSETVAIIDHHVLTADAVQRAFAATGHPAVVVTPSSSASLLTELQFLGPALVLLDLDVDVTGELTAAIVQSGSRVLLLTAAFDPTRIAIGLERGALGFHPKSEDFDKLLARAEEILRTSRPLDPQGRLDLLEALTRERVARQVRLAPFQRLTERERTTLLGLARGRTVNEMAHEWVLSAATVRSHVRGILTKLGVPSQLAAVARAVECGWLCPNPDRRGEWLAEYVSHTPDAPAA